MASPHRASAASEQRNNATRPWSSGVSHRPVGTRAIRSRRVCSSVFRSYMGVIVGPGQIAFTLIPLLPFPHADHPTVPPTRATIAEWHAYLIAKFRLRIEDAGMILPIHDSGKHGASADYELFSADEKVLWELQLRLFISRQKAGLEPAEAPIPTVPAHITYNVSGTNARVNMNSKDSSVNVVADVSAELFDRLVAAIQASGIEGSERARLEDSVQEMRRSYGASGFAERYAYFMSILADHIAVFGPIVAPYLAALARLLT